MHTRSLTAGLLVAGMLASCQTRRVFADDVGPVRVGVVWYDVGLPSACRVDVDVVEKELRAVFDAMGVVVDWETPDGAPIDDRGRTLMIAVPDDALGRPLLLGATIRGSRRSWVFACAVARELARPTRRAPSRASLSRAVGRVAAHELVHVLLPGLPHAGSGLMAARWYPHVLSGATLFADPATRLAIRRVALD